MTYQVLRGLALSIDQIESIIARLPRLELCDDHSSDPVDLDVVLDQLSATHRAELRRLGVILSDRVLSLGHQNSTMKALSVDITHAMIAYAWARLSGQVPLYSDATRSALWQRLWLSSQWHWGAEAWAVRPLEKKDLNQVRAHLKSMNQICVHFKSDPLWNPQQVIKRRADFFAEASIADQISRLSDLEVKLAPLEADILKGLDLSVKRRAPRARSWVQLSLSGEEASHLKKQTQMKRSAANCLLSPWTLATLIEEGEGMSHRIWPLLGLSPSISWTRQTTARELAYHLRRLFGVVRSDLSIDNTTAMRARTEVCSLFIELIERNLGKPAARSFKMDKRVSLTAPPRGFIDALLESERP